MIETSVYRKPSHMDCYVQYSYNHPNHVKRGMVFGLFHQANAITQKENRVVKSVTSPMCYW